jgi:hypothetical protein
MPEQTDRKHSMHAKRTSPLPLRERARERGIETICAKRAQNLRLITKNLKSDFNLVEDIQ